MTRGRKLMEGVGQHLEDAGRDIAAQFLKTWMRAYYAPEITDTDPAEENN